MAHANAPLSFISFAVAVDGHLQKACCDCYYEIVGGHHMRVPLPATTIDHIYVEPFSTDLPFLRCYQPD